MVPLAFLLAVAVQAPAQPDWHSLGVTGNGRQTFYDPASVVRTGPVTRVRVRSNGENAYAFSTIELRCASFEARVIDVVNYNGDGSEASRSDLATPFRAIMGASFLATLAREVCGAAQGPAAPQ
jgi:hypothetical protein